MMTGPHMDACPVSQGLDVLLPTGATITSSTQEAMLNISFLLPLGPTNAISPPPWLGNYVTSMAAWLNSQPLPLLCTHKGTSVLHGARAPPSGLWLVRPPEARALSSEPPSRLLLSPHTKTRWQTESRSIMPQCSPGRSQRGVRLLMPGGT